MQAGTRLGPYEIVEPLGAGGMGEVWLAHDGRLDRNVAIKVLPDEFAADADRLARFEQEARAAAALSHPHIAAVHDVGREGDTHFFVQEHLEGHSLQATLEQGAPPLKRALDLATQIADGLAAAHAAGVLHRDLKPANVFVTRQGHAKILDFGLAKLLEADRLPGSDASGSGSPTVVQTVAGELLGTPGYLAPEQVSGGEIDQRADLFAFGCVLYEMIAGHRAFGRDTVVDTLHAIVHDTPRPIADLDANLPAELGRVLRKCLAKDPANRYQHADDLAVDLRALTVDVKAGHAAPAMSAGDPGGTAAVPRRATLLAVAVVGLLLGVGGARLLTPADPPARIERYKLALPDGYGIVDSEARTVAISPDGASIVYSATSTGDGERLYLRRAGAFAPEPIAGTDGGREPFFSPDGEWLGFGADNELLRMPLAGGAPLRVAQIDGTGSGAAWLDDDTIVYGPGDPGALMRTTATGGEPAYVAGPDTARGEISLRSPAWIPGTRTVLVTAWRGNAPASSIAAFDLDTGTRLPLDLPGIDPVWSPSGHIAYQHGGNLMAVPFDAATGAVTGSPVLAVPEAGARGGGVAIGADGTALYIDSGVDQHLVWVHRDGTEEPLASDAQSYFSPSVSPDGTRVVVASATPSSSDRDIWTIDLGNGTMSRLTRGGNNSQPHWTPDGQFLIFASSTDGGPTGLYRKAADAQVTTPAEELWRGDYPLYPTSISSDGRWLLFYEIHAEESRNCWVLDLQNGGPPTALVRSEFNERAPAISPDGSWFTYVSDESGRDEVYLEPFGREGRRTQVSANGGIEPVWRPDGSGLLYREVTRPEITLATIRFGRTVQIERQLWVPAPLYRTEGNYPAYAIAPQGERLLMIRDPESTRLGLIRNWDEELRRIAPPER